MKFVLYVNISLFILNSIWSQDTLCNDFDPNLCYSLSKWIESPIAMEKKWESEVLVSDFITPLIADLNNDCIPEIISIPRNYALKMFVLDSKNGLLKNEIIIPYGQGSYTSFVIGDVVSGNDSEFIIETIYQLNPTSLKSKLVSYNLDGTQNWRSDKSLPYYSYGNTTGSPAFADFNRDGTPEVYVFNEIYNAQTGKRLIKGEGGDGVIFIDNPSITIAAQLDDDESDLELAAGHSIYKVNLSNINGENNNSFTTYNIEVDGMQIDGFTSTADINLDGKLDVIVVNPEIPVFYIYSLIDDNPQLIAKSEIDRFGFQSFPIVPCIAKIDNDQFPSIILYNDLKISCFGYDGSQNLYLKWEMPLKSFPSCIVSAYDFNGDNIQEIIYYNDDSIRILDARTTPPTLLSKSFCPNINKITPIVADIDNTGQAKICAVCDNRLTVFGAPDSLPWTPARRVWNQYNYHVLNINDDLTVPQYMENNATYQNGRYNNFNVQATLLDEDGFYPQAAASLSGEISCVNFDTETELFEVTFSLFNWPDASKNSESALRLQFYSNNPETGGNPLTEILVNDIINAGDTLHDLKIQIPVIELSQLFLLINGQEQIEFPLGEDDFEQIECDYTDNLIQAGFIPQIDSLYAEICEGESYDFFGNAVMESGKYFNIEKNIEGCDSLISILELLLKDTIHVEIQQNACDSLMWNGELYTSSGLYVYESSSSSGCDSIVYLDLTINQSEEFIVQKESCDSIVWEGTSYYETGIYQYEDQTLAGCDSITILDLTIQPSDEMLIFESVCDSSFWQGTYYSQSGQYIYETVNVYGCDSVIILDLSIYPSYERNDTLHFCQGDSIEVYEQWYSEEQVVTGSYSSVNGCDSIIHILLVEEELPEGSIHRQICRGDSLFMYEDWFFEEGEYVLQKENSVGCDSLFQLTISFLPDSEEEREVILCPGDSVLIEDEWIFREGLYVEHYSNIYDCDSLIIYDVKTLSDPEGPFYEIDCEDLEIDLWVNVSSEWEVIWDNGSTSTETIYSDETYAELNLMADPDCEEHFMIELPFLPDLNEIPELEDTLIEYGEIIELDLGLSSEEWQVKWSPSDIVDCDTCLSVEINLAELSEITLELTHSSGCTYEQRFVINVKEMGKDIFIPNVFSPNGDSVNDSWEIFPKENVRIKEAIIFDRWGNKLTQWSYPEAIIWDGTFKGGALNPGVFVYLIEYDLSDDVDRVVSGHVTLIR